MMNKNYNLVLSGGGSRGYAHIGVLEALYEKGLQVNALSATSAGALIGAFICDGFHPTEIREIVLKEEPKVAFNLMGFKNGLLSLNAVTKFVKKHLRSKNIEQLRLPFYVSVTNLLNSEQTVFNEGPILTVLSAASAIPVLFPPVIINGIPYADGGISNNLPVEPFKNDAHKIIGIYVNPFSEYNTHHSVTQVLDRSIHMLLRNGIKNNIKHCDIFIEPNALVDYHLFESKKTKEIIDIGYRYVKDTIELKS
jgi:NTE family protein